MYMYTTAARDVNIYRGALRGIAFNSLLRGLRLASHPPHETGVVFEWGWIAHASRESTKVRCYISCTRNTCMGHTNVLADCDGMNDAFLRKKTRVVSVTTERIRKCIGVSRSVGIT